MKMNEREGEKKEHSEIVEIRVRSLFLSLTRAQPEIKDSTSRGVISVTDLWNKKKKKEMKARGKCGPIGADIASSHRVEA